MQATTRWLCTAALAGLTGISTLSQAQAAPVVLKFWDNQQTESGLSDHQKAAVQRFEAENPGIKVAVTTIPYPEFQQRLLTAVQGGNAPDVSTIDQIWTAAFAEAHAIVDLGPYAKKGNVNSADYFPGAWASANYRNTLWGMPFNVDTWFFGYYNRALLKSLGIDPAQLSTWDGLRAAVAKLTGQGRYGIGLFAHKGEDTAVVMNSFVYSNGGEVLDASGKCALNRPPAVAALTYMQSLAPYAPKGILSASSGSQRELFLNGSLAVEMWPALEQPTLEKTSLDWDYFAGSAPANRQPVGTYGGWNMVIYQQSQHKDAAWRLIQFMTRADVNGLVVDLVPANVHAAKPFLDKNRRRPDLIMGHLNRARARPLSPRYLEIADAEIAMTQDLFAGMPAQQAAKKACERIDALGR